MGIKSQNQNSIPTGYVQTYYDPKTGQFMQPNPKYNVYTNRNVPQYVPVSNLGNTQQATTYTPPTYNFNNLPSQVPAGLQVYGSGTQATPYQRPTTPTQNPSSGYRPQFDPTFIQQMLAQRFGNQQPGTGVQATPTLTPGVFSGQGQGGLAALRGISGPAPAAPIMGGTPNAPV